MRIKTLQNSARVIDEATGEEKINIAVPPFKISRQARLLNIHYVTPDQIMRPDIISIMYYGTSEYIDVILKANGISLKSAHGRRRWFKHQNLFKC